MATDACGGILGQPTDITVGATVSGGGLASLDIRAKLAATETWHDFEDAELSISTRYYGLGEPTAIGVPAPDACLPPLAPLTAAVSAIELVSLQEQVRLTLDDGRPATFDRALFAPGSLATSEPLDPATRLATGDLIELVAAGPSRLAPDGQVHLWVHALRRAGLALPMGRAEETVDDTPTDRLFGRVQALGPATALRWKVMLSSPTDPPEMLYLTDEELSDMDVALGDVATVLYAYTLGEPTHLAVLRIADGRRLR